MTTYRTINTAQTVIGPFGIAYIHNAAKPFAVIKDTGSREFCAGRFSSEKLATQYTKAKLYQAREAV